MLAASAMFTPLALLDGAISRIEGALLLTVAIGYTIWMVKQTRASSAVMRAERELRVQAETVDAGGGPSGQQSPVRAAFVALVGLGILLLGGSLFVDAAVGIAHAFGMSERLVGLTIVAVGTSLPELVTSLIAARRGHSDLAVGNVIGSNIFNIFLCLGSSAMVAPIHAPLSGLVLDLSALIVMSSLAALFIRTERTISRRESATVLVLYVAFIFATVFRG